MQRVGKVNRPIATPYSFRSYRYRALSAFAAHLMDMRGMDTRKRIHPQTPRLKGLSSMNPFLPYGRGMGIHSISHGGASDYTTLQNATL